MEDREGGLHAAPEPQRLPLLCRSFSAAHSHILPFPPPWALTTLGGCPPTTQDSTASLNGSRCPGPLGVLQFSSWASAPVTHSVATLPTGLPTGSQRHVAYSSWCLRSCGSLVSLVLSLSVMLSAPLGVSFGGRSPSSMGWWPHFRHCSDPRVLQIPPQHQRFSPRALPTGGHQPCERRH